MTAALPVAAVDRMLLQKLAPTAIIAQDQCDVCAVRFSDITSVLDEWPAAARPQLISQSPSCLAEVLEGIAPLATTLGVPERGATLLAMLNERLRRLQHMSAAQPTTPTVVCLEWLDPLMVAGNWVPELVAAAGARDLLGPRGEHSPWIGWERIRAADPDWLVLMPCGLGIEQTRRELGQLRQRPGWSGLRAVLSGRVAIVDGNQYFNRPGPRLIDSAELLAELFFGPAADSLPGYAGRGYQRLTSDELAG